MPNLYCYVDENGLETQGRLFIVALVAHEGDPQAIRDYCEQMELDSGKGKTKWGRARHPLRMDYLRRAFASNELSGRLFYVVFRGAQNYEEATVEAISRAIRHLMAGTDYRALVYVDALSKNRRQAYGAMLRKTGITTHKVQGVMKDENEPLVRLADAIAGFVRDALDEDSSDIVELLKQAEKAGVVIQV